MFELLTESSILTPIERVNVQIYLNVIQIQMNFITRSGQCKANIMQTKNSAVFGLLFFSIAKVQFRMPLCERDVSAKENICKL